jgi:hypothetical protein
MPKKTYKDSTVNNGASPTIKNYTSDVYTWYVSGVPGAVATLEERFSTGSYSYWGSFVTDVPTGVDDIRYTLSDLAVYPNPISGGIMNVDFTTNQSEQVKITLACIDGRQLSIAPYNVISGTNRLQIPVAGLSNGIYYLQMTIGDKTVAVKRIAIAR